jgi:hypothetical protein
MNKSTRDRLITEIPRALDGKYGGTYPQMLVRRIGFLAWLAKDEKWRALHEIERNWLGDVMLRLLQTGDTKTLRQIADARDRLRKDGEVVSRKRYDRLLAYLIVYEREGRSPKIRELFKSSGDAQKDMNNERAIRKLLDDCDLPYSGVPTGRPKGSTNSKNSERLRRLRSLLLS